MVTRPIFPMRTVVDDLGGVLRVVYCARTANFAKTSSRQAWGWHDVIQEHPLRDNLFDEIIEDCGVSVVSTTSCCACRKVQSGLNCDPNRISITLWVR
jgi:hypothetical protein